VSLIEVKIDHNQLSGSVKVLIAPNRIVKCDYSGLQSQQCARGCPSCSLFEFEIKTCDVRGHDQRCVPGYMLLPLLAVLIVLVALALKRVSPPNTPRLSFIAAALMSTFAIADFASDVAFGVTSIGLTKSIATTAFVLLALAIVVNFVMSIVVISRVVTAVTAEGKFVNQEFRERIFQNIFLLSLTIIFCAVSIRTLPFVVGQDSNWRFSRSRHAQTSHSDNDNIGPSRRSRLGLRSLVALLTLLLEDIPLCVLQAVALVQGVRHITVLLAFVLSVASVLLEVCLLPAVSQGRKSSLVNSLRTKYSQRR